MTGNPPPEPIRTAPPAAAEKFPGSVAEQAAVHLEGLAVDEAGRVRGEEGHHVGLGRGENGLTPAMT